MSTIRAQKPVAINGPLTLYTRLGLIPAVQTNETPNTFYEEALGIVSLQPSNLNSLVASGLCKF